MTTEIRNILIGLVVCCLALGWLLRGAGAQDGHSRFHNYYRHWMVPGTEPPVSCCNARVIDGEGKTLSGDCEPTRAEIRNGEWYFWLRQESRWIEIPQEKIVRARNPSSEEGHLCYSEITRQVLCAVPPDTGG